MAVLPVTFDLDFAFSHGGRPELLTAVAMARAGALGAGDRCWRKGCNRRTSFLRRHGCAAFGAGPGLLAEEIAAALPAILSEAVESRR